MEITTSGDVKGRNLCSTYKTINDVTEIMNNPEFKTIFDKYFDDFETCRTFIMFAKLYDQIGKTNPNLTKYEKTFLMHEFISNKESRQKICHSVASPTAKLLN